MNEKTLVFDLDGTIANLYGVDNWLQELRNENAAPYINAEPLYDMALLNTIILKLKEVGWKIAVTSWLSKEGSDFYMEEIRVAKTEWLKRYEFPYDELHLVKYGTTKAKCTRKNGGYQILVDDNEKVRSGWTLGDTINANENILIKLIELL